MAQIAQITVTVSVAWWVRPYLKCTAFVCSAMMLAPNLDDVYRTVMRGIKVKA